MMVCSPKRDTKSKHNDKKRLTCKITQSVIINEDETQKDLIFFAAVIAATVTVLLFIYVH